MPPTVLTVNGPGWFSPIFDMNAMNERLEVSASPSATWRAHRMFLDQRGLLDTSHLLFALYFLGAATLLHRTTTRAFESFDAYAAVSKFVLRTIEANCEVSKLDVRVIPPAIDSEIFLSCARELPPATIRYIGRLEPEKGLPVLLRAMPDILEATPEARLVITGQGTLKSRIEALIDRLALRRSITMEGVCPRNELASRYENSTLVVMPSIWQEPFGIVAVETMLAARGLIATRVGGLKELLVDGITGVSAIPGDPSAIGDAVTTLLKDRPALLRLSETARRWASERFSRDKSAVQMIELYESIAS
jgi:glycosyltransferase involved in cell wall biosynthesis